MPNFGGEPPASARTAAGCDDALPLYASEEIVGRWGFTSYQKEADRARTVVAARGQCRHPYVIAKGPTGGVMMHLARSEATDANCDSRVRARWSGTTSVRTAEPGGSPSDREIVAFDGRVLVTRYVDPDAANRYGNMVYVRCGPRA